MIKVKGRMQPFYVFGISPRKGCRMKNRKPPVDDPAKPAPISKEVLEKFEKIKKLFPEQAILALKKECRNGPQPRP